MCKHEAVNHRCNILRHISLVDVEDYDAFQFVSLTFDEGAVRRDEQCHTVTITNDDILEDSEVFFVTLTSNEPAFLGNNFTHATVTINPDPADCKYVHTAIVEPVCCQHICNTCAVGSKHLTEQHSNFVATFFSVCLW